MKAIVIDKPYEVEIRDVPMPTVGEGEALLRVLYVGICGADVASYTGNQPFTTYPRIPGHEFSAEIIEIPENDKGLKKGDVVTCNPYFNCGKCYSCERGHVNCCTDNRTMGVQRDGAFCEYISMPVERIYPGMGLTAKELALIEPFSISRHAISRAVIHQTDSVLIVGAGPIGLFALLAAKQFAGKIAVADVLNNRLDLAMSYGADGVVNTATEDIAKFTEEFTDGRGFDVCIEACGRPETFLMCIDEAAYAANIILIGNGKRETTFLHSIILKKELNIFGSRNAMKQDFLDNIELAASGKVDLMKMVSGVYEMDKAAEAFDALAHNKGDLAKLLIRIGG
ncbi:MAG: zinc-binding alcohol dehydrogenase family protein [Eubacteriales bacterium]|nr:zinc-binding alcohol dehydrogenase family protein [Clostridia bacterium]MDY2846127.1 zinc-binding alcohol dehydrogenase family protein [Eubacteriales bacterium]